MAKTLTGRNKALAIYLLAAFCLALDQGTKIMVRAQLEIGQVIPLAPSFNLRHVFNKGGAFSIFYGHVGFLALISLAVALGIVWYERKHRALTRIQALALGILLGGTVGNLVDRVVYGRVTDFLDFYVDRYHWPTFNVADICINVGVVLLLLAGLRPEKTDHA